MIAKEFVDSGVWKFVTICDSEKLFYMYVQQYFHGKSLLKLLVKYAGSVP